MTGPALAAGPPEPRRRGGIGPFSARQLGAVLVTIAVSATGLFVLTRPVASGPAPGPTLLPATTPYLVGDARVGVSAGDVAPELDWTSADGTHHQLADLDGRPVRLADLRGKVVWLNFWATWCPPCQGETPVLRDTYDRFGDAGLVVVGVAVQETTVEDVRAYADQYGLAYPIAFDATADIFARYHVFALPTQVFIGPDGRVLGVVNGPLDGATVAGWLATWLHTAPGPS